MRRLDRLVLSEIIGPFFGSAMLFTGLFLAAGEFMRLAEYAQRGVPPWLIVQLVLLGVLLLSVIVEVRIAERAITTLRTRPPS